METIILFLRQLISLSPARYAHVVFVGGMLGASFVSFNKWLLLPNAPEWALIALGITLVLLPRTEPRRLQR